MRENVYDYFHVYPYARQIKVLNSIYVTESIGMFAIIDKEYFHCITFMLMTGRSEKRGQRSGSI